MPCKRCIGNGRESSGTSVRRHSGPPTALRRVTSRLFIGSFAKRTEGLWPPSFDDGLYIRQKRTCSAEGTLAGAALSGVNWCVRTCVEHVPLGGTRADGESRSPTLSAQRLSWSILKASPHTGSAQGFTACSALSQACTHNVHVFAPPVDATPEPTGTTTRIPGGPPFVLFFSTNEIH